MHLHIGESLVVCTDLHYIGKIKTAVHSVCGHIECNGHQVHVTCSLTVSEKCSLNSVCTCKNAQLGIRNAGASVIVGMNRYHNSLSVLQVIGHILDLIRKNMGHCNLYGGGKIDDGLIIRCGLPYIQDRIAYLECKLRLCL